MGITVALENSVSAFRLHIWSAPLQKPSVIEGVITVHLHTVSLSLRLLIEAELLEVFDLHLGSSADERKL